MAQAFVQKTTATGGAGTAITTPAFAGSTVVGNQLIACSSVWNSASGNSITNTDSKANTWTRDKTLEAAQNGGFGVATISQTILAPAKAGSAHTVTTTASKASSDLQAVAAEFSGSTATIDQSTTQSAAGSTTTITATTAATTNANDLVIACLAYASPSTNNHVLTPANVNGSQTGVNSLQVVQDGNTLTGVESSYKIISATGTQAVNWTYDSQALGGYAVVVVVYMAAATATVSSERAAVAAPGLSLGRPTSKLRSARETSQIGSLSALGLSVTTGVAELLPVPSTDSKAVARPGLALGTPESRLRSPKATDQLGQLGTVGISATVGMAALTGDGALAALGLSSTVGMADLQATVTIQPGSDSHSIRAPGMALGTPLAKLKSPNASDQIGQLSTVGISATIGVASLTGSGALSALGLSSTVGQANLAGSGALSALALSSTVGSGELTGAGALAGLGLSVSVGVADLQQLNPGAMEALGLSVSVGTAELSFTFTAPPAVADTGSVPGFVPGDKPKKRRKKASGPVMREGQVFGEEYPISPFTTVLKSASDGEHARQSASYRAAIAALMKELL